MGYAKQVKALLLLLVVVLLPDEARATWFSKNCPPDGFDALETFDLDSYIGERWYPVKAAPVIYAQGQSYCSIVQYTRDESCRFFCGNSPRIDVLNRGRRDSIDGDVNDGGSIKARVPNPERAPAKVKVSGLQRFFSRTNYWIVAAGTYADALSMELTAQPDGTVYDWAIIAGAAPFRETDNGKCMPGFGRLDTRGLWMFCRDPIPPDGVMDALDDLVDSMGLDNTEWIPVIHEGCVYPEAE
jgi:lipocalin